MPIVDVTLVTAVAQVPAGLAIALADALGAVLQHPPGRVWVRVSARPSHAYAENAIRLAPDELPVFVCVLHADLPDPTTLATQAAAIAAAVGACVGCARERVHVEYAPAGRGRIAFGGKLLE